MLAYKQGINKSEFVKEIKKHRKADQLIQLLESAPTDVKV